jgi:UDP-N-acetylmuramate--alanine ligase
MDGRKLHFVGIAGAGMSGLALIAQRLGAQVTGSDRATTGPYVERLRAAGIEPAVGHAAANVPAGAEVVYSTAIGPENPERGTGAPELHRAAFLAELTRLKPAICVSGTHGKTTTTSMIVHALRACGMDPAYAVGGEVRSTGTNADWGDGPWFVVEADESDRSLLELHPAIAVVTNAELDHHTTYASLRDVLDTFRAFTARAEHAIVPPELADAGEVYGPADIELAIPGAHNQLNAGAALAACRLAGADVAQAAASLRDFAGAGRRFERLGVTPSGATVVDDYAHHPTEVAATIDAARTLGPRRVVAVFQPHLYSRTERLAAEFGAALGRADVAAVLDVYPARERAEDFPGVSGLTIAEAVADAAPGKTVLWLPDFDTAAAVLRPRLRAGDLCLVLGAGNVDALGRRLVGRAATSLRAPTG